jgi:peptide/nickel transport system substrate-binding protein
LSGCQSAATPEQILETVVVTELIEGTPVEVIQLVTPTPEPAGPRTLVICQGQEPDTLFLYGSDNFAKTQVLNAIYDGPYESASFSYQPVILEKLPSLADGDATLSTVIVSDGDSVVDAKGEVTMLDAAADPPIMLVPAGGTIEEAVAYQGGDFDLDQLSATFTLLPDLTWSDGTPLTAADSAYSFNLQADPDILGFEYTNQRTASYEAIDDRTIVWTGVPGFKDASYYTNYFIPLPEHIWGQFTPAELIEAEESSRTPLGWGPYIIDEWVQGDQVTLHKNPNYFRADEGLPVFDTVVYRFVGSSGNANIAALLAGECDIIDMTSGLSDQTELLIELHNSGQINTSIVPGTVWEHIDFGIQPLEYDDGYQIGVDRPDFFSDVRTRRAFLMCMDRQSLVDTIFFGQSIVIDTYIPPNHPLFNPDVRHYDFDPVAGSVLLEEVGWVDDDGDPFTPRLAQGVTNVPDGTKLEIIYETTGGTLRKQVTAILQQSLAECGIQANIEIDESGGFWDRIFGRNFELGEFAWITYVEPPCELYISGLIAGPIGETWISIMDGQERTITSDWDGQNIIGFANEDYDLACNTALNSLPGQPEYEAGHLEAQRIFAEQLPVAPLFLRTMLAATRPDMCNFIMDPTAGSEFWNIEEFDYGEGCEE